MSLGFSNIIVSDNNFNNDHIKDLFDFLMSHGFRRIIFSLDHDVTASSLAQHLETKKIYFERLRKYKPRGITVWLETNIIMSRESAYEKQLSRLSLKGSDFLLTTFPLFDADDWIDASLNYILYKQKKNPCFMSFERNILTYPDYFVKHLIKTRCSTFMLDINSFAVSKVIPYISELIDANDVIIPGICGVLDDYTALEDKLEHSKSQIGQLNYTKLLINSSKSSKLMLGI